MKAIAILMVAVVCIAALRITIREHINEHEQIMLDSKYEKY